MSPETGGPNEVSQVATEIWIGLVHAKECDGSHVLGENMKGGYVHALGLADGKETFQELVNHALRVHGLYAVSIDDINTYAEYRRSGRINSDFHDLATELSEENPIAFDIFDAYSFDDA
ncbi:MAG TPA: hypothetical protein VF603_08375 [Allosphingosinicella sp.]|jgi:hypothetical protein